MVAGVDRVKTAPLVNAHRAEKKIRGGTLNPEALPAGIEQLIHLLHLLPQDLQKLVAVHRRPVQLAWARKGRSRRAVRHVPEYQHHHLQQPLHHAAVPVSGLSALESSLEQPGRTAANQYKMLD